MIHYREPVFRPPSEADSLILQATYGCTHNRCAFCSMYRQKRFQVRPEAELLAEIDWAGRHLPEVTRVFLADGDAFALSPSRMSRILERLYQRLPALERVTAYASPQNFAGRKLADLHAVRAAGLTMLYLGLESGDDEVLRRIQKGSTCARIVEVCQRAQEAGFDLSITVILGLAGPAGSARHAEKTAEALDRIRPRYASALTLMRTPRQPSFEEVVGDPAWRDLTAEEVLAECRVLIDAMRADGIEFRSNHASNYLALKGRLQRDKPSLLALIDRVLADPRSPLRRPEFLRAL